ncbi:hypothetical protein HY771_02380 [Candidatus Uhrbacteria bacterium]|nr:hypothetical protein [Candidatus Uhrbacteria bacterium]
MPWNDLCEEFKRALRNGDASVMRPIVERMIADCNSGNRRSMPQLIIASIRGPGVTRGIAKDFLDSL